VLPKLNSCIRPWKLVQWIWPLGYKVYRYYFYYKFIKMDRVFLADRTVCSYSVQKRMRTNVCILVHVSDVTHVQVT